MAIQGTGGIIKFRGQLWGINRIFYKINGTVHQRAIYRYDQSKIDETIYSFAGTYMYSRFYVHGIRIEDGNELFTDVYLYLTDDNIIGNIIGTEGFERFSIGSDGTVYYTHPDYGTAQLILDYPTTPDFEITDNMQFSVYY